MTAPHADLNSFSRVEIAREDQHEDAREVIDDVECRPLLDPTDYSPHTVGQYGWTSVRSMGSWVPCLGGHDAESGNCRRTDGYVSYGELSRAEKANAHTPQSENRPRHPPTNRWQDLTRLGIRA